MKKGAGHNPAITSVEKSNSNVMLDVFKLPQTKKRITSKASWNLITLETALESTQKRRNTS